MPLPHRTRARLAALLLVLAQAALGCASGYVTYFEPVAKGGARTLPHPDPYVSEPPPAGVELEPGALALGCTNLRKFVLLPIPWFRRGFRPDELEIQLRFLGEPRSAVLDLGAVSLSVGGATLRPARVSYQRERPAPVYLETLRLDFRQRYKLDAPRVVTFVFADDLGDADEFRVTLGELRVDGVRSLPPPVAFTREGEFVVYRLPRRTQPSEDELALGGL